MLRIGLTGGIGCGKTTAARYFKELNIPVVDADEIARELVKSDSKQLTAIIAHFGRKILNKDSTLNRKLLAEIIFQNDTEKKWLEDLLHPLVYKEIEYRLQKIDAPYCIIVIPLLLETEQRKFVDRILVIDAPETEQIIRTVRRDQISYSHAKQILSSQIERKKRLAAADDIICNNGSIDNLKNEIYELHKKYLTIKRK